MCAQVSLKYMNKLQCFHFFVCGIFAVFLNSCHTASKILNYSPEPDYFTSQRREVVEHRARHFVEYSPGQVYRNTKTLYWMNGMSGKDVTEAHWLGNTLKVLPPGTQFTVARVRARFTLTSNEVVPTFRVSGLPGGELNVSVFRDEEYASNGRTKYIYNREYFTRER